MQSHNRGGVLRRGQSAQGQASNRADGMRTALLRETAATTAAILDAALDCIVIMDHNGRIVEFNPAAERVFGYTRGAVLGKQIAETIIPPHLREQHLRGLQRYLDTGEGSVLGRRIEITALRADGTEFPVELAITRVPGEGPPMFAGYLRDITERQRIERRRAAQYAVTSTLAESRTMAETTPRILKAICENLGWELGAMWSMDPAAAVLRCVDIWHGAAAELAGFAAVCRAHTFLPGVGLPGRVWRKRESAWIRDVAEEANFPRAPMAAKTGLHGAFAFPILLGPDILGVMEFFSHTVQSPDEDMLRLMASIGSQIGQFSERKRTEEALVASKRQSEDAARLMAALARVGQELIGSLDTPILLERLCQVTVEVLGCDSSHTLLWQPAEDVYVPVASYGATAAEQEVAQRTRVPRELMAALFAKLEQEDVAEVGRQTAEMGLAEASGERVALGRQICMALRQGKDIIGIQTATSRGVVDACTSQQRLIAQGIARTASMALANAQLLEDLVRANRLKSEFVSTMSHELRTPLNVILGFAEMAEDRSLAAEERQGCIGRIKVAGRELLELIQSTLEIGKIEAGREAPALESVSLPQFWVEVGEGCSRLPRKRTVSFEWSDRVPDVSLVTDRRKLTVVLRNLVGNALKFTEHGWVRAEAAVNGDTVVIQVADTGVGIPLEDQQLIFEMFRQCDASDSRRYGGVGLGLYIVQRFVQQLGGRITVESVLGRGATFTVTLPRDGRQGAPGGGDGDDRVRGRV
jgi:PAS domain S-box-containing protein